MHIAIVRLGTVMGKLGRSRSGVYADLARGLLTRQVSLSRRTVGWPLHEVDAIARGRIAGLSEAQLQVLVDRLHSQRQARPIQEGGTHD
jgi:prophage regulatory protein